MFTAFVDDRLHRQICQDLQTCVTEIQQALSAYQVKAILLVGSLGRGEGSVFPSSDAPELASDYDLLAVVATPVPNPRCPELRLLLTQTVGRPVEIGARTPQELSTFPRSLSTMELRLSHVLWGDPHLANTVLPVVAPAELDPSEGSRLLFNRSSALLGTMLEHRPQYGRAHKLMQLAKAVSAVGEANLILHGSYSSSSYVKIQRVQLVPWLESDDVELIRGALEVRLGVSGNWLAGEDFYDGDDRLLSWLSRQHLNFEAKRMRRQLSSWTSYSKHNILPTIHRPKSYLWFWRLHSEVSGRPRWSSLSAVLSYLVPLERRLMSILPHVLYTGGPAPTDDGLACILLGLSERTPSDLQRRFYMEIWEKYCG